PGLPQLLLCALEPPLRRILVLPRDRLGPLGAGNLTIDLILQRQHALPGQLAAGARLGDLAPVAVEQRQRQVEVERELVDAVVPIVARCRRELRVLACDGLTQPIFRLGIAVNGCRQIAPRQQRAGPRLLQGARCDRRRRPPVRPVELEAVERLWRQAECCGGITLCALRVGARLSLLLLRLEQRVLHGDQGCGRVLAGSHAGTLLLQELLLLPDQPVQERAAPECALPVRQRGDELAAHGPGGSQQLPALAADRDLRLRYRQPPQGRRAQR